MTDEKKMLLEGYSRLSRKNRLIALAAITGQAEMEENARRIVREALAEFDPLYASRDPAPMGARSSGGGL